jgi:uncharacterized protein (TIGR03067 family)
VACVFLSAGFVPAGDAPKDVAKKDLAKLQGTWTAKTVIYNGKDFLADGKGGFRFVVKDDVAVIEGNKAVKKEYARIKLKLDPSATPRLVDITVGGGSQAGAVIEGIYELKGDEWRICARVLGKERPLEFGSPEGSSIVLLVLGRQKPE